MKTVTIRDEFLELREFTANLSQTFDKVGSVIHNGRNVIKKVNTDKGILVVKNFKGMYFFNRLAYSLFRESKAARSYTYSRILNEKGIMTPAHVGWLDWYSGGILTRSYFVSVYDPYQTLQEIIQYYNIYDPERKALLLRHLAEFVLRLHTRGIYHEDLSLGNILVIRTLDGYDFELVDLNRIKFRKVPFADGVNNFATLRMSREDLNLLIDEYARLTGHNSATAIARFWKFENRKFFLRRIRKKIRYYTINQVERILTNSH
jgi:hypothetical protein